LLETHCSRYHKCNCATYFYLLNLGIGSSLPKTTFMAKFNGVWAGGASQKCGTSIYFCNHWSC